MFPLSDENPTELIPYITYALILANLAAWFFIQGAAMQPDVMAASVCQFGTIPAEITGSTGGAEGVRLGRGMTCQFGGLTWSTLVTSMFMHGGWLHLLGNLWFLWIFGNNIEDSMGHLRFLAFYLITGLVASGAHIFSASGSPVPTVGASGAISGVMGAYLLLFPRIRIKTLFIIVIFIRVFRIPAWFVLGEWFVLQLVQGFGVPEAGAAIAFWAHIGGFVAGLVLVKLFENKELVTAKKQHVKLDRRQIRHRGWL